MSKEVSMFSELEVQSEISQLLDELYGNLERAFPGGVGGRELPAFLGASSKSASASGDRRASAATSCSPSPSQVDRPSVLAPHPVRHLMARSAVTRQRSGLFAPTFTYVSERKAGGGK